ncbi:unnamed protein product [Rhizoctonia solani]|uniref:BTB domain-containing protein n=1 Tax=Rhizoctonia solani TaxID=456999 RepID=A0A8H2XWZ6_9AGAM|nr:unnamed protein product [Rhizoctonia solani]
MSYQTRAETETSECTKTDNMPSFETTKSESAPNHSRDPDYYFEDGCVILLVEDTLFKIHASLMKAQSQAFVGMLAMPSGDAANTQGLSEQHPIIIPQVKPPQFRNLLKMIYSPASSAFHSSLQSFDNNDSSGLKSKTWDKFAFYLDVATLCHKYEMAEMEQWAKTRLGWLMSSLMIEIASGAEANPGAFLDAIQYAQTTQNDHLINNTYNLAYSYIYNLQLQSRPEDLLPLFRTPGLQELHPSVFGCIFSVFLGADYPVWQSNPFTKLDRMALFSGQVRLSPIPSSFKDGIRSPLFKKPESLEDFRSTFEPEPSNDQLFCNNGCDQAILDIWLAIFTDHYYRGVSADSISVGVTWLSGIIRKRVSFIKMAQGIRRPWDCSMLYINQLDKDIQLIYTRFSEYYCEIE